MQLDRKPLLSRHHPTISTAGTIIFKVTYGYTVQEENDPFVELADKVMAMISIVATPGAFLVDVIPACETKVQPIPV